MEGKTKDGHELEIGSHYYNEYGESIILESVLKDEAHGLVRYLVTPFFEGEALTPCGDGGIYHEISGVYEHLGEPRVINAVFKEPPTAKINEKILALGETCGVIKLAVDALEKKRERVNRDILNSSGAHQEIIKQTEKLKGKIIEKTGELDQITAKLKEARQKLSELEDSSKQFDPGYSEKMEIGINELAELRKRSFKLQCLEDSKVYNWDWYDSAIKPYIDRYPEG